MFSPPRWFARTLLRSLACLLFAVAVRTHAAEVPGPLVPSKLYAPKIAEASEEGELAIKRFQVAPGLKVELFAAEPLLAHPIAFAVDEKGRFFVVEVFRMDKGFNSTAGAMDIRGRMSWLDEDLASRTALDRETLIKKHMGADAARLTEHSDRIRLLEDRDGNGKADYATVFADGFATVLDGLAADVLARKGSVWFANLPNLWLLADTTGEGRANQRRSLHFGYGLRVGYLGHDLHGLRFGPDGKLYYAIGDRGAHIETAGRTVSSPDSGAVFRCNPDGSDLELFATGLRNPQKLAFDDFGNLFTCDNNADLGDLARWVYVVEGGDSGWRVGYQHLRFPMPLGPWNAEKLWDVKNPHLAAYVIPPVANITQGPSGISYYPGTGLPERYAGHFFVCDFMGANGGVWSFGQKPKGASFEINDLHQYLWRIAATDAQFGVEGGLYVSDWVGLLDKTGKGRLYRVFDTNSVRTPLVLETKKLRAEGMEQRSPKELAGLLAHADGRIRQEAQFALAEKSLGATAALTETALQHTQQLARVHAVWGLGQIANSQAQIPSAARAEIAATLARLTADPDVEVRAQSAKALGDGPRANPAATAPALIRLLRDPSLRVQAFAAISLGKLGDAKAWSPLLEMLRANADREPIVRHAGVLALAGQKNWPALVEAAADPSAAVRLACLLALRRGERPEIARFLADTEPRLVLEAARAIYDVSIAAALPLLAALPFPATNSAPPEITEPLARRILNANFRLGTPAAASLLATRAAQTNASALQRTEALQMLADWAAPSGRDRVVGLWRPLTPRAAAPAAAALRPVVSAILHEAPAEVRSAAARAAGSLRVSEADAALAELVGDARQPVALRVEALKALGEIASPRLGDARAGATAATEPELKKEAARWQNIKPSAASLPRITALLERGSLAEQQAGFNALQEVPGAEADARLEAWLDKLLAGTVAAPLQLDLLEAAARRTAPGVVQRLATFNARRAKSDTLAAFRECLEGGSAAEGRKIFRERVEASCLRCHKLGGEGGEVGPALDGIGARQTREYLLEAMVAPNTRIAAGFETLVVTLKSGGTRAGVVKSENATELVLQSLEDGLLKLRVADIAKRERGLSAMTAELASLLSKRDLRDLVEFLANLR